jgi:WD40 repeat protein
VFPGMVYFHPNYSDPTNRTKKFTNPQHTHFVRSVCLSPDGCHLVSASHDYSVRIWDLETNEEVGGLLWHDDYVSPVAMSSDGQYLASATSGPSAKVYVWNLEAVLKRARGIGDNAEPNTRLKEHAAQSRDTTLPPRRQTNNRGLARYGNDFWGDDTNRMPHRSSDTSPLGLRNLFGSLRSGTQPTTPAPTNKF